MQEWSLLILVLGIAVANVPALVDQWRNDRAGLIKTLWLVCIYALYVALGILLMLVLAPRQPGESKALFLAGVLVGWIFYGALTLMRVVPRYREPPRWLMRFGVADLLVLGLVLGCLAAYLWW
ncbi:MAG TPA: hypothetical protein VHK26_14550 [Methyloceanibacter sp.]|jgi:drug/metabolite transporter (DMT)-like permease|nr:hypothetical protein [Methyloceanibacter sp.]